LANNDGYVEIRHADLARFTWRIVFHPEGVSSNKAPGRAIKNIRSFDIGNTMLSAP
jgi:hypothetical protein